MERLTHEADFGLEEWEQTLYTVKSDPGGAYNILDIANYEGEKEFNEILKNISLRLKQYEDTDLTPEQIRDLKERDTEKAPEIHKNKYSDTYTCPNCKLVLIHRDETGWFCGKRYNFCPDCGQRLKWEEES